MKKIKKIFIALLMVLVLTLSCGLSAYATPVPWCRGDVNENFDLDIADATLIQRHIAKLGEAFDKRQMAIADVDNDGSITITDATAIQRYLAKLIKNIYDEVWDYAVIYRFYADYDYDKAMVNTPVTFCAAADCQPAPATYEFYVNDELCQQRSENSTFTYTFPEAGYYSVKVVSYNDFGTSWSESRGFVVSEPYTSAIPKLVSFHFTNNENVLDWYKEVEANAIFGEDNNYYYAFYLDGELKQDFSTESIFKYDDDLKWGSKHTIKVELGDKDGNVYDTLELSFEPKLLLY